ncbi:MAG TPA: cupin domain-containing protein [Terriglobales bacterium]|nr:cupin domain-containing protein [Terriglobales bacterium]
MGKVSGKMAQKNHESQQKSQPDIEAEHYYDYEARFVKQKREQERINILPRVIKPAMFAKGEFALGDMRVFSRYTVAPLSMLTCSFLDLRPGARTEPRRMLPSLIAYIIAGGGAVVQDDLEISFGSGDVVLIPPYTTYQFIAHGQQGFRAWLPQIRLWHGQGLLWRDPLSNGRNESESAADGKVASLFASRRDVRAPAAERTRYDWFLSRLADENRVQRESPRLIRAGDCPWENSRQGRVKFYISRWTEVAARGLDLIAQEIAPGQRSGEHRHIFEELLLVVKGRGYDLHDGTQHRWAEGDLICVPPMIVHQHINDGKEAAQLVSVWPQQPGHELLGGIEQISNASDWKS